MVWVHGLQPGSHHILIYKSATKLGGIRLTLSIKSSLKQRVMGNFLGVTSSDLI